MAEARLEVVKRRLLLGEGADEKVLFERLLEKMGLHSEFQVESYGGKDSFGKFLSGLKGIRGFQDLDALLITRDADDSADRAFQSVVNTLRERSLPAPGQPGEVAPGKPTVGVYIVPGSGLDGQIEDLCLKSVAGDPAFPCIDAFFECLAKNGPRPSIPAKARLQAFLASRENPTPRIREAAQMGVWDFEHPAFESLKGFVKRCVVSP